MMKNERPKPLSHVDQGNRRKVAEYNERLSDHLRRETEDTQKNGVNCGPWGDGE